MFERERGDEGRERPLGGVGSDPSAPKPNANRKGSPLIWIGGGVIVLLSIGFWLASC
jgi:hypothetical protein